MRACVRACVRVSSCVCAMSSAKEDDLVDADGDGIPDVQQIDASSLATRKLRLFLNHVDPPSLSQAVVGLYQGIVGMLAVLKFKFAKSVALGLAIGACCRHSRRRAQQHGRGAALQRADGVELCRCAQATH